MGESKNNDEFIIAGPQLPNGNNIAVHHRADNTESICELRHGNDGMPLPDDAVIVKNRCGPIFDIVGSVADLKKNNNVPSERASSGPAKVTSDEYRLGWDQIFSKKMPVGQA